MTEQRRVILDFENDLLKTVRGDVVASAGDASKSNEVADNSGTRVINPSAKAEDKSLFGALKFWKKEPVANPAPEVKAKPSRFRLQFLELRMQVGAQLQVPGVPAFVWRLAHSRLDLERFHRCADCVLDWFH